MSKGKSARKRRQRAQKRPSANVRVAPASRTASTKGSVPQSRVGGEQALVRGVEMSLGAQNQYVKRQGRTVVESTDPSIPLDRVPYFTQDLIWLAITAACMVGLLAVGSYLVPHLVH